MATHNAEDGTGGLDGSIQFEMARPEVNTTFRPFLVSLIASKERRRWLSQHTPDPGSRPEPSRFSCVLDLPFDVVIQY